MTKEIKIGDLVETCSLMPGVVMKMEGDDIEVRMLHIDEYAGNDYAGCSIKYCGVIKLTALQAFKRLSIGHKRLGELYQISEEPGKYEALIDTEFEMRRVL